MKILSAICFGLVAVSLGNEPKLFAREQIPAEATVEGDSPFGAYEVYSYDADAQFVEDEKKRVAREAAEAATKEKQRLKEVGLERYKTISAQLNKISDDQERFVKLMQEFRKGLLQKDQYLLSELRNDASGDAVDFVYEDGETVLTIASCWLKDVDLTQFAFDMGFTTSQEIMVRVVKETRMESLLEMHHKEGGIDMTPMLFDFAMNGDLESVLTVLGTGFDPDSWYNDRDLLDIAISRNNLTMAHFFIENGVNVNGMDTHLMKAVEHNNTELVNYLLDTGANEGLTEHLSTVAVLMGNADIVERLLDSGVPYQSHHLQIAIEQGRLRVVKPFFDHAVAVVSSAHLVTAVEKAVDPVSPTERHHIVDFLLANGGNAKTCVDGETHTPCLVLAAAKGDRHMVDTLLLNGANKDAPDANGKTALDVAKANGHQELVKVMQYAGFQPGSPPVLTPEEVAAAVEGEPVASRNEL